MACFILCQNCGITYDTDIEYSASHQCCVRLQGRTCSICNTWGDDMIENPSNNSTIRHSDPYMCITEMRLRLDVMKNDERLREERFFDIEHTVRETNDRISAFVEGRRAAVEATKEKHQASEDVNEEKDDEH